MIGAASLGTGGSSQVLLSGQFLVSLVSGVNLVRLVLLHPIGITSSFLLVGLFLSLNSWTALSSSFSASCSFCRLLFLAILSSFTAIREMQFWMYSFLLLSRLSLLRRIAMAGFHFLPKKINYGFLENLKHANLD